jgi:diguanylate cyclase
METGGALSVLLIDIDYFKQFNDTYGHQVGDQVLRLTAGVFRDLLREADFAARYGGEELIGVLEGASLKTARDIAERIRVTVAERKMRKRSTGEELGAITVSIGVAEFQPGESIGDLVERADRALYQAKRSGRNRTATELDLEDDLAA